MPDTVTLVLDAEQYNRELAKIAAQNQRLGNSGEEIGRGFLRGERAARVASANIVQGLATANSAADATLVTMQSLERVFRIPIGTTIIAAGVIAAGEAIGRAVDSAVKLNSEIRKLSSFSLIGGDFLSTDKIVENLDQIGTKIDDLFERQVTRSHSLLAFLTGAGGFNPLGGIIPALNAADEEKINQLRDAAVRDVDHLTKKQNDLNRAEMDRLEGMDHMADLDKAETQSKEKLYQLSKLIAQADLAGTEAAKQLLDTENDRLNIEKQILEKKRQQAQEKSLNQVGDFFADVGSGRFAKAFAESQQRDIEAQHGQQLVDEIKRGQAQGFFQDPLSQAILRQAERVAQSARTGLTALINADFSNLLILSKYDFSGLAPLNNLQIQIQ